MNNLIFLIVLIILLDFSLSSNYDEIEANNSEYENEDFSYNEKKYRIAIFSDQNINNHFKENILNYVNIKNKKHEESIKFELNVTDISSHNLNELKNLICDQMSTSNILMLISLTKSIEKSNFLNLFLKPYQIPYISLNTPYWNTLIPKSNKAFNFDEINMLPDFVPVLMSLIKYHRLPVLYIFDHEEGTNRYERLLEYQSKESDYSVTIHALPYTENFNALLKCIEGIFPDNSFVLMLDFFQAKTYLNFLNEYKKKINNKNNYLILVNLALNQEDLTEYKLKIIQFSLIDFQNSKTSRLINDLFSNSTNVKLSFKEVVLSDSLTLINNKINRLIGTDMNSIFGFSNLSWQNNGEIYYNDHRALPVCGYNINHFILGPFLYENLIKNINGLHGLSGGLQFDYTGKRIDYLIDIYDLSSEKTKIGTFSSRNGLEISLKYSNPYALKKKKHLVIVSILDQPFLMLSKNQSNFEGFSLDLAEELSKLLNFTFEFRLVKDGRFGSIDDKGNWNGIMGEILRREADLAIAPLTITPKREKYVDFSVNFIEFELSLIAYQEYGYYNKVKKSYEWNALDKELVIYTLIGSVSIILTLYLVNWISLYNHKTNKKGQSSLKKSGTNELTFFDSIWYFFCAFLQEGFNEIPKSFSARFVLIVSWIFTLTIFIIFAANLTILRHLNKQTNNLRNFDSLEELVNQTEVQYAIMRGGSTEEFFKNTKIDLYEKMWSNMKNFNIRTMTEGMNFTRKSKGGFVFIAESGITDYIVRKEPCDLTKVGLNFGSSRGYGIATPIGSDLRNEFNEAILKLKDDGTLEILKQKWWFKINECPSVQLPDDSIQFDEIKISYLKGLFVYLAVGIIVSLLTLIIEIIYKCYSEAKENEISFGKAFKMKFVNKTDLESQENEINSEIMDTKVVD